MDGVVNFLKPPGMSSADAVNDVRRLFNTKRVGHTGTLDPGAAGVLPICVGRAVRLFDYLVDKRKEYIYELSFGLSTDTQDAYGKITESRDCEVTEEELLSVLPRLMGQTLQNAPMYSALKHNGRKLYELALEGKEIPEKLRPVDIREHELIEQSGRNRFLLRVDCSRGTYVRTLCQDLGQFLGVPAHLSFLLRTRSGEFCIEDAYSNAELERMKEEGKLASALRSAESVLSFLPELRLDVDRRKPTTNGLDSYVPTAKDGLYRCYCGDEFMGTGRVDNRRFRLELHLY